MSTRLSLSALLFVVMAHGCDACDNTGPIKDETGIEYTDADGDGYNSDEDCDDADPTVYPGAEESCDEVDNDCDGEVDEGAGNTYYADSDYDGYGDPDRTIEACELPDGYVNNTEDCDDTEAAINPAAVEICNGVDDDCDELIDDEDDSVDITTGTTWYADADGDGYGTDTTVLSCDMPTGYTGVDGDCDDSDAAQFPGADEYCNGEDDDCDGEVDEETVDASTTWYADDDGDGYGDLRTSIIQCTQPEGYVLDATDCNDAEPSTHPGADEYCDGADNDCDGTIDEDDAVDGFTWYADTDGDGFGDASVSTAACYQPTGYVLDDTDCDDSDAMQFPGADEYCNGEDDDCDGTVDEDESVDVITWYADRDGDGYGDAATTDIDCTQPSRYVLDDTDCDDNDSSQFPGADEYCNGEDDDCDGDVDEDEALDVLTWYADTDGDNYGNSAVTDIDCNQPSGYVALDGDCDDTDAAYNPGAAETDCTDPNDYNCDGSVAYADVDADGFAACEDCDDTDAAQHPGADEYCNFEDDDCDGLVDEDEALDVLTWYADTDADRYGDPAVSDIDCGRPAGYVLDNTDCDDTDALQFPGAVEYCNGEDDDCDGDVDEDDAFDVAVWYADSDGDTYGDPAVSDIDCDQPSGYVADDTDCDDSDAAQYPGADEYCNGEDDDCDGTVDEDSAVDVLTWYADRDGDTYGDPAVSDIDCYEPLGYVADNTDCDDSDAAQYPGADEYCNGEDDDCDGAVDEDSAVDVLTWYADTDGDTYGDPVVSDIDCYQPTDYVLDDTDCDDSDAAQYPGADEYCNGEDDDCDGLVDEDEAVDVLTWYADTDGDTFGDAASSDIDCDQPSGYVADDTDCDDTDPAQFPGATEYCNGEDDDCDGTVDEDDATDVLTWYADSDGDTYGDPTVSDIDCYQPSGYVADDTDCDDTDPAQFPGATEYCNGEDDDCDGTVDEDDAADVLTWYADSDADTYGDPLVTDIDCYQPSGFVADNTDCDDTDSAQYPGAVEYCNGEDDDCDGAVDEDGAADVLTWYADSDGDTYGDPAVSDIDCYQPSGYVADSNDCDDSDPAQYPGADEYCNGEDDDCDGTVDEDDAVDSSVWYADSDGDTYGDLSSTDIDCYQPSGYVADSNDCDDTDATQYPGATEYCNGEDDDCDGTVDEDGAADVLTWYADSDGDTYGDPAVSDIDCYQPSSYVADATDCDDTDAAQYPGATEYCNGEDDDCDGTVDEDSAADATTWYADSDVDGYGDPAVSDVECYQPTGYISDNTDCDDSDAAQYPGADEYCNGEDDDCDGTVDEDGDVLDGDTYYADTDSDGTGDPASTIVACAVPSGYVDNTWDCDDSDATEPVVVDAATGSPSGVGSMTSPLDTVQGGIDNATQCVIVFGGIYYEAVHMNGTDLEVSGVEGADATIIDASGLADAAISIDSGETSATLITGFTLTGAGHLETEVTSYACTSIVTCYDYYYTYCGGGVYVASAGPRLVDLLVQDSTLPAASTVSSYPYTYYTSSYGGGVCLLDSSAMLEDVDVVSNWADQGGGLYADELTAFSWIEGLQVGNGGTDGGGTQLDGGMATLVNLASSFNYATTSGGGVLMLDAYGAFTNIALAGDDSPMGGGIYLSGTSAVDLLNSVVYGAGSGVGVLGDTTATLSATYNDVYGNVGGNYSGVSDPTGVDGNISSDPLFVAWSDDGDDTNEDLHLQSSSPCIDAGNPATVYDDADGTQNDMGAYGGQSSDWD